MPSKWGQILASIALPFGFFIANPEGINIVGAPKESSMDEPISTYYFKHGTAGSSGGFIWAIKEVASPSLALPTEQLIEAGQTAAETLKSVMFAPDSILRR